MASAQPFSSRMMKGFSLEKDASILLEFDPSSSYEGAVRDYAMERLGAGGELLVFTSESSPVAKVLEGNSQARFFLMTEKAGTSTTAGIPAEKGGATFVRNEPDVILSVLSRDLKREAPITLTVIFDNLSNMVLLLGVEKAYKFARRAIEMIYDSGSSSLFLLVSGAHDDAARTAIESVFRRIIVFDREGLDLKK